MKQTSPQRAIISVFGKDDIGIVAKLTSYLATHHINIVDISQTIMDGIFTMIMLVDMKNSHLGITNLSDSLKKLGKEIGQEINVQDEEIIRAMHRI